MKKILFITPDFYPNSTGFANASTNLVNSICKYGKEDYDIWVFTNAQLGANVELGGIHVVRYKNNIPLNRLTFSYVEIRKAKFIESLILENGIDVIFFETNTFPFLQNYLLKRFKERVVVRIHSTADTEVPVFKAPESYFQKQCNNHIWSFMNDIRHIVSTSNFYLDFVRRHFLSDNVYKMWNNKSYGLLFNTAGDGILAKLPVSENTFLTMGKMSENGLTQKGMEDLLNAVSIIKKEGNLPADFKLIIVGTGVCLNRVINLINVLSLSDSVQIIETATHDEVFKLMAKSKAIILLSRYEGQSMFITESLASGKPIIVTDNNGMQDMIIDGYNGKIVKTGNPQDAAKVITEVMSYSIEVIKELGDNSMKLYKDRFSTNATFVQFDELIKKILI